MLGFTALATAPLAGGEQGEWQPPIVILTAISPTGIAASIIADPSPPLNGVFATGAALAMVNYIGALTLVGSRAFGLAQSLTPEDFVALSGASGSGVAHSLSAADAHFELGINATALANNFAIVVTDAIIGVHAAGMAYGMAEIGIPGLTGSAATGVVTGLGVTHVDGPTPGLTGTNALGVASGIEATRTLASATATAEAQPLPYFYSSMIGVSAIGGEALVTILSISFDTDNAINVHGAGSANIVADGNELVINIIGGASQNLPLG